MCQFADSVSMMWMSVKSTIEYLRNVLTEKANHWRILNMFLVICSFDQHACWLHWIEALVGKRLKLFCICQTRPMEKKMTRTRKMRRRKKAGKRFCFKIFSLKIEMSQSVTKITNKTLLQCFLQKKSKDAKSRRDSNASDKYEFTSNSKNSQFLQLWN